MNVYVKYKTADDVMPAMFRDDVEISEPEFTALSGETFASAKAYLDAALVAHGVSL